MEDKAIEEIDNMRNAAASDISAANDVIASDVSNATNTAVDNATEALNDLGIEFVYQKAADIAWQMQIYLEAHPDLTQADLQGDTYLIYESPQAQQEGSPPLYAGVHYGSDDSTDLSLIGNWIVTFGGEWKRFVDEDGNTVDLTGKWIMNASDGSAGIITSNTASTVSAPLTSLGSPFAELDWDSGEDEFWAISIQNINRETSDEVENIGYSVLVDGGTGIPVAHPNPLVVGLPDHIGRSMFPLIYELMDQTIASGQPEKGIFPFDEDNNPDTPDVDRFAVFYPVKNANGESITIMGPDPANPATLMERPLMVSTAVMMKNFNEPAIALEEKLQENNTETLSKLETAAKNLDSAMETNRDVVAAEISDGKDNTQTTTIIVVIIMVIVVAIISILFGRSVVGPIKKLTVAADKVSKGDLSVTVQLKSNDEIGELAESFERMVTAVKFLSEDE